MNKAQKHSHRDIRRPVRYPASRPPMLKTCPGGAMRKFVFLAIAIGIAAGSMQQAPVSAQDGAAGGPPPIKYRMFLEDGAPTRSTTNLKLQEAKKLNAKKDAEEKGKVDPRKTQSPELLATPNVTRDAIPPAAGNNHYKVKVRFPTLPANNDGWARTSTTHGKGSSTPTEQSSDDNALNAAACKAAAATGKPLPSFCRPPPALIDRSFIDRMEADRVEQLRAGPGGFNPNKP
jgi:hypothetical protein